LTSDDRTGGFRRRLTTATCARPDTFDLLGVTHYWAMSRKGFWVVKQKAAAV